MTLEADSKVFDNNKHGDGGGCNIVVVLYSLNYTALPSGARGAAPFDPHL